LDGSVRAVKLLENGIAIIETNLEKQGFIQLVKSRKPIFIRHMNSVDFIIDIDADGLQRIVDTAGKFSSIAQGQKIAVQVRKGSGDYSYSPMDVKNAVDAVLKDDMGAVPEVKDPEQIVSVLLCCEKAALPQLSQMLLYILRVLL
jgi:hypothetical protein